MSIHAVRVLLLTVASGLRLASWAFAACGDGTVDPGESCDLAAGNGSPLTCCTTLCEYRAVGFTCRPAAGPCDIAETCTGSAASCPADAFQPSNSQCRAAAGTCDLPETCSGSGPDCPADAFRAAGTVCRAPAGACDVTENCDGTSPDCPPDAFQPSTAVCRPATGDCDVAESCTGTGPECPPDAIKENGTVCRSGNGTCDPAEVCDGSAVACPPDAFTPDGTVCDDGSACTSGDACFRGACVGTTNVDACIDDFLCYLTVTSHGEPAFTPIPGVHLVDQFDDAMFDLIKRRALCLPEDDNAQGTVDPATHLTAYLLHSPPGFVPRQNITVTNQLGFIHVDALRPELLLVPAAKSVTGAPPPPDGSSNVDHYKCYRVRLTLGTPRFPKHVTVPVTDQFNGAVRTLKLKRPRHLCVPVEKNGELVKNPTVDLMCYSSRGTPRPARKSGVFVTDQFAPTRLDVRVDKEVCLPSQTS